MSESSELCDEEIRGVVVDNGGFNIQAGFAGDDAPRAVFPSIVGHHKNPSPGVENWYVGDEAHSKRRDLNLIHPIESGICTSWDDMEKIWHHTFHNELRINPSEFKVLITESSIDRTKENREKAMEIMFEAFDVMSYFASNRSVLSLYASGRTTGMVLSSGDRYTVATPIYLGYALPHAIQSNDIGGANLTEWFAQKFNLKSNLESARDIKEKLCYIAVDYDEEMKKAAADVQEEYEFPDGKKMIIGTERFEGPEMMLFKPNMVKTETPGIHKLVSDSVHKCDLDIRRDLFENIVLKGGNTMFRNIGRRLKREVLAASSAHYVSVVTPPERKYSSWIGGSILASLSTFQDMWITAEEYADSGASIVHRKAF